MPTTKDELPELARKKLVKMRDLINTIKNAPVQQLPAAIKEMEDEINALLTAALEAAGRRV